MIEVCLMIEGQNGLNWARWQRIARITDDLGFAGLFRSDHFTNASAPDIDSLELWVSLTWLASHTRRIEFGSLVSPVSFRDPFFTARTALQVNDLSGNRLRLGLGAGWNKREHEKFGYDLLEPGPRFDRFEEGLQVITRLMRSDTPVSFQGEYYRLNEAVLLPRPVNSGGPPIIIGGNGTQYTLPLAARYADEWNAVSMTPATYAERSQQLSRLLSEAGRDPAAVRRSMMTHLAYGRNGAEVERLLHGSTPQQAAERGIVYGEAGQVIEQINRLAEAGVQRIMLQWIELDDVERLEDFARAVLPEVHAGS